MGERFLQRIARRPRGRPKHADILTPREWEVFRLLEDGLTNKEIAVRMGISENGAKYHVAEIMSKLGVNTRREAVERMRQRVRPPTGLGAWLWLPGRPKPRSALGAGMVVAAVALLGLGAFAVLVVAGTFKGGSNDGVVPAPGQNDLSRALADFGGEGGGGIRLDDPVEYCRAVGSIDAPDSRYVGPANPGWMAQALADAAGIPEDTTFRDNPPALAWRCAEGRVLACTYGANLPCDSKADTSTEPSQRLKEYCAEAPPPPTDPTIPNYVPVYVTGRATIYRWECRQGEPAIEAQMYEADAQGFIAQFWYEVVP